MVRHAIFFFLFFAHVCAGTTQWHLPQWCQPSNGDTASSNMAAVGWQQQHGQQHIVCNAPTGGVRPDVGEGVQLLGKSTGSYGEPETTRVSLVLRWTS